MVNERSGARLVDCGVKNVVCKCAKVTCTKKVQGYCDTKTPYILYTHLFICLNV